MKRTHLAVSIFVLLFSAVFISYLYFQHFQEKRIISISTNPWVGYTPFMYAQEMGWLEETPFRFLWLVDLSDNSKLYKRGFTKGFTATQYELLHFENFQKIKPIFLIDRSDGADVVVSNRTIDELRGLEEEVDLYMEMGSLHDDFFKAFVKEHELQNTRFRIVDASQKQISILQKSAKPTVILTYHPYFHSLLKLGYKEIASTKTIKDFYVIDGCYVDEEVIKTHKDDFVELKAIFIRALLALKADPKAYYLKIKSYLEDQSYEDFLRSIDEIEWIYNNPSNDVLEYLKRQNINIDEIIR
ncbi:MAG: hypothetical protein WCR69_03365 [Sulfuricurvum sp.]